MRTKMQQSVVAEGGNRSHQCCGYEMKVCPRVTKVPEEKGRRGMRIVRTLWALYIIHKAVTRAGGCGYFEVKDDDNTVHIIYTYIHLQL